MKGEMTLYDKYDNPIRSLLYEGKKDRDKELASWKSLYGQKLKQCYYHLRPYTTKRSQGIDSEKKPRKSKHQSFPKIIRAPKTFYTSPI